MKEKFGEKIAKLASKKAMYNCQQG